MRGAAHRECGLCGERAQEGVAKKVGGEGGGGAERRGARREAGWCGRRRSGGAQRRSGAESLVVPRGVWARGAAARRSAWRLCGLARAEAPSRVPSRARTVGSAALRLCARSETPSRGPSRARREAGWCGRRCFKVAQRRKGAKRSGVSPTLAETQSWARCPAPMPTALASPTWAAWREVRDAVARAVEGSSRGEVVWAASVRRRAEAQRAWWCLGASVREGPQLGEALGAFAAWRELKRRLACRRGLGQSALRLCGSARGRRRRRPGRRGLVERRGGVVGVVERSRKGAKAPRGLGCLVS